MPHSLLWSREADALRARCASPPAQQVMPMAVGAIAEVRVSVSRIRRFMLLPELARCARLDVPREISDDFDEHPHEEGKDQALLALHRHLGASEAGEQKDGVSA